VTWSCQSAPPAVGDGLCSSMVFFSKGISTGNCQLLSFFFVYLKVAGNSYGLENELLRKISHVDQISWTMAIPALTSTTKTSVTTQSQPMGVQVVKYR